jgi:hypothetical protein
MTFATEVCILNLFFLILLYSPNLAPSGFISGGGGSLKDDLRGRSFSDEDELQHSVREELRRSSNEFYATGIQRLTQRCKNYVDNEEDFMEK